MVVEVGVREFRSRLSEWLGRAAAGDEIVVTERGRPVARVTAVDRTSTWDDLVARGVITPAPRPRGRVPLPRRRIKVKGGIDAVLREARGRY